MNGGNYLICKPAAGYKGYNIREVNMGYGKGAMFERDICRTLSLWWTAGEQDDCFWRNRTRRTGKAYNAQLQEGDIIAVRKVGIALTDVFCIECKSGYSSKRNITKKTKAKREIKKEKVKNIPWDLLGVIDDTTFSSQVSTIAKFWEQTTKAAKLTGKIPFLIFKRDYHVPVVVVDYQFFDAFNFLINDVEITVKNLFKEVLHFYRLESFLKSFCPEDVKKYAGDRNDQEA